MIGWNSSRDGIAIGRNLLRDRIAFGQFDLEVVSA
jgi:hypothetical protein